MYPNYKRLFINQSINLNERITLTGNQCHYIKNVLRNKENDFLKVFNGKDGEWLAKIIKIEKKTVLLCSEKKINNQINSPDLWLFFSPIKKDRLNILVQKSTELGVKRFIPIKTERSNIKNININNLRKNAIEASEQSGRLDIPEIQNEYKLEDIFSLIQNDRCILYCDERSSKDVDIIKTLKKIENKYKKWSVIIGPEGGFTSNERKKLNNLKNIYTVTLGKRILRSDTAATVALHCIQQFIDV